MATDWETEREYITQDPPNPSDPFYQTPPASISRRSLHRKDSLSGPSSSPARFPSASRRDVDSRNSVNFANDESISPLDPRRFTPTLHASLVSEILSLRRDLESKTKEIDSLELNLQTSRTEAESLQDEVSKSAQETRSLKRQLQLLEGGSNSAITELSNERDEALESISDVRKRLEVSQRNLRTEEQRNGETRKQWDEDKRRWNDERRNLERKVHVVEGRLKIVLNEIASLEAVRTNRDTADGDDFGRDGAITRASDVTSIRSNSAMGRRSSTPGVGNETDLQHFRYSMMSQLNGQTPKQGALNLADELAFDEEDEDNFTEYTDDERPESRTTIVDDYNPVDQGQSVSLKARKMLGLSLKTADKLNTRPLNLNEGTDDNDDAKTISNQTMSEYRDMGVQFTPPPSPKLIPENLPSVFQSQGTQTLEDDRLDKDGVGMRHAGPVETIDSGTVTNSIEMKSTSCQTIENDTESCGPRGPRIEISDHSSPEFLSSSTQTDGARGDAVLDQQMQMAIPLIAVHPPASNPPSPRSSVVLPPQTKSAASQTDAQLASNTRTSAMQTEEIRVDKRTFAALLPSVTLDKQVTPELSVPPYVPPPPRSPRRPLRSPPPAESAPEPARMEHGALFQAYPGNNDNGPLTEDEQSTIRRPMRSSSLFAGFGDASDEESLSKKADVFSDDDLLNRPMVSYTLKSGRLISKKMPPVVDSKPRKSQDEVSPTSETNFNEVTLRRSTARSRSNATRPTKSQQKQAPNFKERDIRRTAMISSSTAAHQLSRPRSPSAPSIGSSSTQNAAPPPFPVPVRFSSRKTRVTSDGAQSPTPQGNGKLPNRMGNGFAQKALSTAVVSPMPNGQQSPPALSTSSVAPDSPLYPPMPLDEITAPRNKRTLQKRTRLQTPNAPSHSRAESTATTVQPTSVVDAIAQTMVGGWMWKYVRRRKSFGKPETSKDTWDSVKTPEEAAAAVANTGVRHKRWVWLAPYERAIMWSSKQPTSGPALLGKSGRKLTIQSVLDVKDENPLPKGASPQNQFNRSILILTPQRALKFTAMTIELHYVWLTALSFLSHSSMAMTDLAALPPAPQEEYIAHNPTPSLRRNPIRDSIRVAKGKHSSRKPKPLAPAPVPEVPFEGHGEDDDADAADPPFVPRFSSHTRKRSNTAPRAPIVAFRNFSNNTAPSTYSATTAGSSELYSPSSIAPGFNSGQSSFSRRTSEASGPVSATGMGNFFDAVGTVRMEAFVDRSEIARHRGYRNKYGARKKDPGYWPQSPETDFPRSDDGSGEVFLRHHDDPFRGF